MTAKALLLIAVLLTACTSAPASVSPPQWVFDLPAVYPNEKYIAQQGEGKTRQEAEFSALGALSLYFKTNISIRRRGRDSWTMENGATIDDKRQLEQNFDVRSETRLSAVRYAQDAWYNPQTKQWHTVAYIDCDEAWAIFEPQLKQKANVFRVTAQAAETEKEPLKQIFMHGAALYAAEDLRSSLEFAQFLSPQKSEQFNDALSGVAEIGVRMEHAKSGSQLFIDCVDATLKTATTQVFSSNGIPVTEDRRQAKYICKVEAGENIQTIGAGTMYTPELTIIVSGGTGTLFSYSTRLERIGAQNPDIARWRAYNALANHIQSSFAGFINSGF